jgi:hypothetical protein
MNAAYSTDTNGSEFTPASKEECEEILRVEGEPDPGKNAVIFSLPNNKKARVDMTLHEIKNWQAFQKRIVPLNIIPLERLWVHWSSLRAKLMDEKYQMEKVTKVVHSTQGRKFLGLLFKLKHLDIPSTILVDSTQFSEHAFY